MLEPKVVYDRLSSFQASLEWPCLRRLLLKLLRIFLAPDEGTAFAYLRIGTAVILLSKYLKESGNLLRLYGENGLFPWQIGDFAAYPTLPRLSGIAHYLAYVHISSDETV